MWRNPSELRIPCLAVEMQFRYLESPDSQFLTSFWSASRFTTPSFFPPWRKRGPIDDVVAKSHLGCREMFDQVFPGSRGDSSQQHRQWDRVFARVGKKKE